MDHRVIHLHPHAPPKPPVGAACNGCGVCCAAEPCPVGMLVSRRLTGRCSLLAWSEAQGRYRCGLLVDAPVDGVRPPVSRWLRQALRRWAQRRAARWIAAGTGCDADVAVQAGPSSS